MVFTNHMNQPIEQTSADQNNPQPATIFQSKRNRHKYGFFGLLIVLFAIIVYFFLLFFNKQNFFESSLPQQQVFRSQQECEEITGRQCSNQACDFVPTGKTVEEVCGKNFKKGWVAANQKYPSTLATQTPIPSSNAPIFPGYKSWFSYINTKHGYEIQYPPTFQFVKGPVPDSELTSLDTISIEGLKKENDPYSGVVLSISVNPMFNGTIIQCVTNDECLAKMLTIINKSSNEVKTITKTITNKSIIGFEYKNENKLYTQTFQYFVYPDNGKIWNVNITLNNYVSQDIDNTINQILSTFKYSYTVE